MHCDQCGKENRPGSKFCRSCGAPLSEGSGKKTASQKVTWKNPIIVFLIVIIILGGLSFGGYEAYAYYQVQSKITNAENLQNTGDFSDSLSSLADFSAYSPTSGQQNTINTLKVSDQKFLTDQSSFNAAVALETASSTASTSVSQNLQTALADLQSIDASYPLYKNVQTEMTKVQNSLVTSLQREASASAQAAATAKAQATAASEAKAQAEENEQKAESEAASAASDASAASSQAVETAFVNQLQSAYTDFKNIAEYDFNQGIDYSNESDYSDALIWFAKSNAACQSSAQTATDMSNNFTNLPNSYNTALYDLQQAADWMISANNSAIDDSSYDDTSATTNSDSDNTTTYLNDVSAFLANPQ